MTTKVTYCRICEAACGLVAELEAEQITALRPDPHHVVSKGFACAKGTRFLEVHRGPGRVNHPLRRQGGELKRTTWRAANADIGSRLRRIIDEHGPHAVAVYIGNPAAFSYTLPVYGMAFVQALGTRNYFSAGSLDCNNKFFVAKKMLGSAGTQPVPDLDRARFALLVGTNPSVSQSSFVNAPRMVERLTAIQERGGRVMVVDPRRTETARMVGEHVPIRPDTDAAFLLGLLHVILREKLHVQHVVDARAIGFEQLGAAVEPFSPDRVAKLAYPRRLCWTSHVVLPRPEARSATYPPVSIKVASATSLTPPRSPSSYAPTTWIARAVHSWSEGRRIRLGWRG